MASPPGKESWDKFIGIIARPQEMVKGWSEDDLRAVLNSTTPVELSSLTALERADIVAYWKTLNDPPQGTQLDPSLESLVYRDNAGHFLATYGAKWTYQPSSEVDKKLASSLPIHFNNWKARKFDKQNHPLYLVCSGPGTGKSRLLEELPALCLKAVQHDAELYAHMSGGCIVLKMSFENGTVYTPRHNASINEELGLRAAYNFMRDEYSSFSRFADSGWNRFGIGAVVDQLIASTGQSTENSTVFFLVDGLQMLSPELQRDTLRTLSTFINNATFFAIAAVAGTYYLPIAQILHSSPQWRESLLPPPVDPQAIIPNPTGDETIELLIADVGHHGRAIEALAEKLEGVGPPRTFGLNDFMAGLREILERKYPSFNTAIPSHILAAIALVFTGEAVNLDTHVADGITVEGITQSGLFSLDNGRLCCPYILLWLFAKRSGIPELEQINFCTYDEQLGGLGSNTWEHWQRFVHLFHVIKSHILSASLLSGADKYRGAVISKDLQVLKIHRQPLKFVVSSEQLMSKSGAYSARATFNHEHGTANISDPNIFIENKYGASAGDAFGAVRLADDIIVHEVIQDKQYGTASSRAQFDHEYNLGAKTGTDIFIYFTTGDLTTTFFDEELPSRSVVVSAAQFKDYFGLFAGRAFITARVDINKATRTQLQRVPYIGNKVDIILQQRDIRAFANRADYEARTGLRNTIKRKHSDFLYFTS